MNKNTPAKSTTKLTQTITTRERNKALLIIEEIAKSPYDAQTICEQKNMDYQRFQFILGKKDLAEAYLNALDIQKKLTSNQLLQKSLTALEQMLDGEALETEELWAVDDKGRRTLQKVKQKRKAPDFKAVEKTLKAFAPSKFNDQLKPEQIYSLFIAFNNYIATELGRPELVAELMTFEENFMKKF